MSKENVEWELFEIVKIFFRMLETMEKRLKLANKEIVELKEAMNKFNNATYYAERGIRMSLAEWNEAMNRFNKDK